MENDAPNESNEVKVTVTLVLNASFSWLEKPTKNLTYHLVTCTFLGVLAVISIAVNLCLLSAIFCNSNLKRVVLNQLVSTVSVACVLDCVINVPYSLYHLRTTEGTLPVGMCRVNTCSIILINLMITWGVCGACFERWFSIFQRNRPKFRRICKQLVVVLVPVAMGTTVILPIALGIIEVRVFPDRYSCSIATQRGQCYRISLMLCFAIPVSLGLLALLSALIQNYRSIKNVNSQGVELSYAELFFEESHLWNEWQSSKFVACITLLYLFLELPFIVSQINPVDEYSPLSPLTKTNSTSYISSPRTQVTSSLDRAYTWCKFIFCVMFPITTLLLRKDIRRKICSLMSIFKANSSITSKSVEESASLQGESPDDFLVPQVWRRRRRLSSVTCLTSPIVFGKSKVGNAQTQLLDLSTGMAKWKASYEETKKKTPPDTLFFDDAFEDEEEFTEFSRYEDGTEEEINSSEDVQCATEVKEVAVQTNEKFFGNEDVCFHVDWLSSRTASGETHEKKRHKNRTRRLSRSFTASRTNRDSVRKSYYLTYPKLSTKVEHNLQNGLTTSDLLKVLKAYRSKKYVTTCDILPRSTGELMDCNLNDGKNIVSL